MEMATGWTGEAACALQAALRMSNETFASHLRIGLRTVASWHEKPTLRPRPEIQRALDTVLEQAPPAAKERFALLTGGPAHTESGPGRADAGTQDGSAAADAEHRLIADENISLALSRLDQLAGWEPGMARRKVAALLSGLDRRHVLDRAGRRARIGRRRIAQALGEYYHGQAGGHGRYSARCGEYSEIVTSVLTHPDWLDLDCLLTGTGDRLTLAGATTEGGTLLDQQAAEAAAWRLAETLSAGTRLADMPLYRLAGIDVGKGRTGGSLAIAQFASYALTLDLLEGELADALTAEITPEPGKLPLRDRYLPDVASVLNVGGRLCAGARLPCARSPGQPIRTGAMPITSCSCRSAQAASSMPLASWR